VTTPDETPPPPPPRRTRRPGTFWLLLGMIVLATVFFLTLGESDHLFGLERDELRQFTYLIVLLVFVGSALIGRSLGVGEIIRSTISWLAIFLVAVGIYAYRDELGVVGARLLAVLAPGVPIAGHLAGETADSVVIMRQLDGHFFVRAEVEDTPMTLMVDTGASFVTLTIHDAERIGIDPATLSYSLPIRTANGIIQAAPITIGRLAIGSIVRERVPALVSPPDALEESLLGMSFLNSLSGYAISGDRMALTP